MFNSAMLRMSLVVLLLVLARTVAADDASPPAWAPKLSATVQPPTIKLGEPVTLDLRIKRSTGVSVTLPVQLPLDPFVELSREEQHTADESHFTVRAAAYELGALQLPAIELTAVGPGGALFTLKSAAVPITVVSVLQNEPNPELKGVAPPVSVYEPRWWVLYALVGLLVVAAIVLSTMALYRRWQQRQRKAEPPPPERPADIIALERLGALNAAVLIEEQKFKELYLALSDIIREYIGRRYSFDALEMTTTEIGQRLRAHPVATEHAKSLEEFFTNCDLVKFAKYRPEAVDAQHDVTQAETLVRATTIQPIPATAGETPAIQGVA